MSAQLLLVASMLLGAPAAPDAAPPAVVLVADDDARPRRGRLLDDDAPTANPAMYAAGVAPAVLGLSVVLLLGTAVVGAVLGAVAGSVGFALLGFAGLAGSVGVGLAVLFFLVNALIAVVGPPIAHAAGSLLLSRQGALEVNTLATLAAGFVSLMPAWVLATTLSVAGVVGGMILAWLGLQKELIYWRVKNEDVRSDAQADMQVNYLGAAAFFGGGVGAAALTMLVGAGVAAALMGVAGFATAHVSDDEAREAPRPERRVVEEAPADPEPAPAPEPPAPEEPRKSKKAKKGKKGKRAQEDVNPIIPALPDEPVKKKSNAADKPAPVKPVEKKAEEKPAPAKPPEKKADEKPAPVKPVEKKAEEKPAPAKPDAAPPKEVEPEEEEDDGIIIRRNRDDDEEPDLGPDVPDDALPVPPDERLF